MALDKMKKCKANDSKYYFLHGEFDSFAYKLMLDQKLDEALKIFQLLSEYFPNSDIAFDSLGEVFLRGENKELAIKNFKKALELNPGNENAKLKIGQLKYSEEI